MAIGGEPKPNNKEGKEKIDLRILLADDDLETAGDYKGMLKLRYSEVEIVENGRRLMEYLLDPNKKVDFLITDYNMPEMTGLEALRQIRTISHLKDLPVIMMSADMNYEDIKKEVEALGGVFLKRPVDIDDLFAAVEKMRVEKK